MLNLCPECRMSVSDQAEDCPHCGYRLRPQSGSPAAANAPGRVCDYCKMENPWDVMFCVSCGAPIKVAKAAPSQSHSDTRMAAQTSAAADLSRGGAPSGPGPAAAAAGGNAAGSAGVRPPKPPVLLTLRTVFNFILLALQWGLCLFLTLLAVVLATELSAGAIGLTGAAVIACPLIKKLPFKIHPALRALAVFVLFLVGIFTG